jgi:hypothetical protein
MPQLKCACDEAAGDGCGVQTKQGTSGFLIRSEDYRSGDWAPGIDGKSAGPKPNNPCQNIFNDCVLDGFTCDNYYTIGDGCPALSIGDPVGNRPIDAVKMYTETDWKLLGRCDANELCNGITGVQYLVCKTWREALPMALAWVALIELFVAAFCFIGFFILLRFREDPETGRNKWRPCAPLSVSDVKTMIDVIVADQGDRQQLFNQASAL